MIQIIGNLWQMIEFQFVLLLLKIIMDSLKDENSLITRLSIFLLVLLLLLFEEIFQSILGHLSRF